MYDDDFHDVESKGTHTRGVGGSARCGLVTEQHLYNYAREETKTSYQFYCA